MGLAPDKIWLKREWLEDTSKENVHAEPQRRIKNTEQHVRDIWDKVEKPHKSVTGVPEKEEGENGQGKI